MKSGFNRAVSQLTDEVSSLKQTLPLLMAVLTITRREARKELHEYAKSKNIPSREEDGRIIYTLPIDLTFQFQKKDDRLKVATIANRILPRSYLVTLVSQFDAFVGRLMREIFKAQPGILNASERKLTFAELSEFSSMDDARDYVIEKEVEAVLRDSHADHFKWLENKLGIPLRKDLAIWPDYIELTERRNLFVHTDGVVSRQYLDVCREHGVKLPEGVSVGTQLRMDSAYFNRACDTIFELGVKLTHVVWRKLIPEERGAADEALNGITYNLIEQRDYQLALSILDFAVSTLKTHSTEEVKLYFQLNRAQAYKWLGNDDACRKALAEIDWSAKALHIQLARDVLLDNYDDAAAKMRALGAKNDKLRSNAYRDWPIFREFRRSSECAEAYKEVFGETLEVEEESISVEEDTDAIPSAAAEEHKGNNEDTNVQ
jgi:hypothetical protein